MIKNAALSREDLSKFVIHLTRDDTNDFSNGDSAFKNLISILKSKSIYAIRPHCIFNKEINDLDKEQIKKFKVACFTETPLTQIHLLARKIEGRQIELEPYGIIFKKETLIKNGAQQAIYINSYNGNNYLRECTRALFNEYKSDNETQLQRIIPYLNAMHERYDFTWEREWRLNEDFCFEISDIVAIILPETGHDKLRNSLAKSGIPIISPGWPYEQIVIELADQQKKTKKITLEGQAIKKKIEK